MRQILVVTGLQRSGNHAVLDWVASLFPTHVFHNNQPHDLFTGQDRLTTLLEAAGDAPCVIFSFEDSVRHSRDPAALLFDDVVPFPDALAAGAVLRELSVLRDPYNTWASRVAANARTAEGGKGLTSDPSWELFRANWLAMAARHAARPDDVLLFNRWKDREAYRRRVCAQLGGTYSEKTLKEVPRNATGSSFDGLPRPSYGQMLRQLPKYASGKFLSRLAQRPSHYVRRFVTPASTGDRMKVNERWKFLLDHPQGAGLFADDAVRAESLRIFGFAVSSDGMVLSPEAA